ncbi:MAG TPA: hypothetical protein VLW49_08190 [Gaiellaceae bacterium]|nr:hypothetical protein [Gaiellaceae bacterium]
MWDWAVWASLAAAVLAVAGGVAFVAVRALQAWRDFKRVRRHVFKALDTLLARAEELAESAAAAADLTNVQPSLARLRVSLARLAVLRQAAGEAQETFGRIAAVVPRK